MASCSVVLLHTNMYFCSKSIFLFTCLLVSSSPPLLDKLFATDLSTLLCGSLLAILTHSQASLWQTHKDYSIILSLSWFFQPSGTGIVHLKGLYHEKSTFCSFKRNIMFIPHDKQKLKSLTNSCDGVWALFRPGFVMYLTVVLLKINQ